MIKRGTWVMLLLAVALAGALVLSGRKTDVPGPESRPTPSTWPVFTAEAGQVTTIQLSDALGSTVRLARGSNGLWVLEAPLSAPANQGLAESAATQVGSLRTAGDLEGDPAIFGLDSPAYTIAVTFASGQNRTLEVGDETPTQSGYYARLDGGPPMIVSLPGLQALLNLLDAPPYLATPTPSPSPALATATAPASVAPTSTLAP